MVREGKSERDHSACIRRHQALALAPVVNPGSTCPRPPLLQNALPLGGCGAAGRWGSGRVGEEGGGATGAEGVKGGNNRVGAGEGGRGRCGASERAGGGGGGGEGGRGAPPYLVSPSSTISSTSCLAASTCCGVPVISHRPELRVTRMFAPTNKVSRGNRSRQSNTHTMRWLTLRAPVECAINDAVSTVKLCSG